MPDGVYMLLAISHLLPQAMCGREKTRILLIRAGVPENTVGVMMMFGHSAETAGSMDKHATERVTLTKYTPGL